MDSVMDTLGRKLHVTVDRQHKRIILFSSSDLCTDSIIASFTVEQCLDFATMLITHVAPLRMPDADHLG